MSKFKSFNDIVNHYNNFKIYKSKVEAYYSATDIESVVKGYSSYFKNCMNIDHSKTIVNKSDLTTPSGHQRWITKTPNYCQKVISTIKQEQLFCFKGTFEELYDKVLELNITSGDLYRYDLCVRIGLCTKIYPKDFVYLHRGSLEGASELEKLGYIKLPTQWNYRVSIDIFKNLFPNSSAYDIEDMLCIYKNSFHTIKP